jgi:hypothetical protein
MMTLSRKFYGCLKLYAVKIESAPFSEDLSHFSLCMSLCADSTQQERVDIRICSPLQPVRLVSIRLMGLVRALNGLYDSPRRFIFKGMELRDSATFSSYGVHEGDAIIALTQSEHASTIGRNHWLGVSRDQETFNNSVRWMIDATTADQAARLRDLHLIRLEGHPRRLARIYEQFLNGHGAPTALPPMHTSYLPLSGPSTEALPIIWGSEEDNYGTT